MKIVRLLPFLLLAACYSGYYTAAPATLSGATVHVRSIRSNGYTVKVNLFVINTTNAPMYLHRHEFALRMPDGRVVMHTGARDVIYTILPGAGHPVNLNFDAPGLEHPTGARVIIGGISYATDPRPRVLGEIPIAAQ